MPHDSLSSRSGHLYALLAALFFALNVPATTYMMQGGWLDAKAYAMVRIVGGCVVCWFASLFVSGLRVQRRSDWGRLFAAGCGGMAIFFLLYAEGLGRTSPIDASIVLTISPIVVLLVSALTLQERITRRKGVGIALSMVGAILVIVLQGGGEQQGSWLGNLIVMGTATVYGCYLVVTASLVKRYRAVAMLRWIFLFALLVYAPLFGGSLLHAKVVTHPQLTPILIALFIAIFPSGLTFIWISKAMKLLPVTTVSMYNYAIPIIATTTSIVLGQDRLEWIDPVATLLVIAGVYIVNGSPLHNKRAATHMK